MVCDRTHQICGRNSPCEKLWGYQESIINQTEPIDSYGNLSMVVARGCRKPNVPREVRLCVPRKKEKKNKKNKVRLCLRKETEQLEDHRLNGPA